MGMHKKLLGVGLASVLSVSTTYMVGPSDDAALVAKYKLNSNEGIYAMSSRTLEIREKLIEEQINNATYVASASEETEATSSSSSGSAIYNGSLNLKTDIEKSIANALSGAGYNDLAIAAFMGNFWAESSVNPLQTQIIKGKTHNGQVLQSCLNPNKTDAHGFAQWDTTRRVALIQKASTPEGSFELDHQIQFMLDELKTVSKCKPDVLNAQDLEHATWNVCSKFERCGTIDGAPASCASKLTYEQRSYANAWDERYSAAKGYYGQ